MAGRSDTGSYSQMNLPLSFGVPTGLGHRANIQSHDPFDSSRLLPFSILDWLSPVIVKIDRNLPNSWVYRDVLEEVLEDADLKRLVRPWPPGQYTVTRPGYDPKGGHYVDLTLRNKSTIRTGAGRDVRLPLTILTRERRDGNDIGVVLCQDYLQRFAATPSIQIGIEQSLAGMHPPNATQQVWQTIGTRD
jgi:hypothetical protein